MICSEWLFSLSEITSSSSWVSSRNSQVCICPALESGNRDLAERMLRMAISFTWPVPKTSDVSLKDCQTSRTRSASIGRQNAMESEVDNYTDKSFRTIALPICLQTCIPTSHSVSCTIWFLLESKNGISWAFALSGTSPIVLQQTVVFLTCRNA